MLQSSIKPTTANVLARMMATRTGTGIAVLILLAYQYLFVVSRRMISSGGFSGIQHNIRLEINGIRRPPCVYRVFFG
jgi:hypothetical protein